MDCSMIPFHILLPNIPKPVVSFQDSVYNFLTYIFFFQIKKSNDIFVRPIYQNYTILCD